MLEPALQKGRRGLQKSIIRTVPAPVGGWNARDPLSAMPATDAVVLENWFPRASSVDLRPGATDYSTGYATAPKYLVVYNSQTTQKLFASTDTATYEITSGGVIGASVLGHAIKAYANVTVAGGSYLFAAEPTGGVQLKIYDGAAWSVAAITGMTLNTVVGIAVAKRRVWFCHRQSSTAYYLAAGAIAGAATAFPLGQVFTRGGTLVAIGNWTLDGGDGQDDYVVFVSSEGEVAIYKGTDPSTSATFALVGVFYIGEPLNYACLMKFGGDLLYLSQNGLFPLSKALLSSAINYRSAFTAKIETAFADAVSRYSVPTVSGVNNDQWSMCVYPTGNFLLINIPITSTYSVQYVMNTITGAWTTFTGWASTAFEVFQGRLFFTTPTAVAEGWVGIDDFGANITGRVQQAYSNLGAPGKNKHVEMLRPIMEITEATEIRYSLNSDYAPAINYSLTQLDAATFSLWGTGIWGTALWGGSGSRIVRNWITAFASDGFVYSLGVQLSTNKAGVKWISTDFAYKPGGVL